MTVSFAAVAVAGAVGRVRADAPSVLEHSDQLTIDDLLKVAVRVAPELATAAFDVSTAAANQRVAIGVENWSLNVDTINAFTRQPASTNRTLNTTASVSRLLPTNGVVALAANVSSFAHDEPRATSKFTTVDLSVAVIQPLLANAGRAIAKARIQQTQHALSAATIRRTAVARTFVADVTEAYWRLALGWRRLDVLHLSLAAAEKQQATIQRGLSTGAIAKSEALPFAQAIASRQIDIANAERDIVLQSIALRTLVGLEIPPDAPAIHTIDLPRAATVPIDTAALVEQALATSDELAAALEDVAGAEVGLAAADRNLLPTLDVSLQGDVTSSHRTLVDAVQGLRYDRGYNVVIGASFALPVGRDAAKGAYAANRAAVARTKFDVFTRRKAITADVVALATQARTSARTVELSDQVVSLALQNVEAEQRKFELGKSTSNDVVLRQDQLELARLQLEAASADATIALARLEAATGKILQHYGLEMADPDQLTATAFGRDP